MANMLNLAGLSDDLADLVDKHPIPFLLVVAPKDEDLLIWGFAPNDVGLACASTLRDWLKANLPAIQQQVNEAAASARASLSTESTIASHGQISPETEPAPSPSPSSD